MSAPLRTQGARVDLDSGVAILDVFDDDECRLWTGPDEDDWAGVRRDGDEYYWVDTRNDSIPDEFRIGEQAVLDLIHRALEGRARRSR